MDNLDDALADLRRSMERFAEAYVIDVARMLSREMESARARVDLTKVRLDKRQPRSCPATAAHTRHTWRFPDSDMSDECPGVELPTGHCPDQSDAHPAHDWFTIEGGRLTWCPGIADTVPNDRQCPDNLAHTGWHTWHLDPKTGLRVTAGTPDAIKHVCPGLGWNREILACPGHAGTAHPAHVWGEPSTFCTGRTGQQMKAATPDRFPAGPHPDAVPVTCFRIMSHDPHDGCDGKGTAYVPAGNDRFA